MARVVHFVASLAAVVGFVAMVCVVAPLAAPVLHRAVFG